MASTYTSNTGIEKPGSGEQAGTWGTTTNTNFDIIDQAVHGQLSIAISGSRDLTTSDGATSDGVNPVIILTGNLADPTTPFELRVTPTDQKKHYTIKNDTDAACRVIYKGVNYSTLDGVEILAGGSAAVTGDGGGGNGKFKSLTPATDLVNDLSPQLGGNLDVNAKNILFGDSSGASDDRLVFGAGTDLEIYHDATDSIIDNSTGALKILGDDIQVKNGANDETSAKFIANGAVELYHNNVKKIETTADGVDIVGDISLTGGSGWGISVISRNATAVSNGQVSSSTALTVDGNSGGSIAVGMSVTGTGISGNVKVATVTSQNDLVLDTAITIPNDLSLTFASNDLVFSYGGTAVAKIASDGAITSANDVTAFGTV